MNTGEPPTHEISVSSLISRQKYWSGTAKGASTRGDRKRPWRDSEGDSKPNMVCDSHPIADSDAQLAEPRCVCAAVVTAPNLGDVLLPLKLYAWIAVWRCGMRDWRSFVRAVLRGIHCVASVYPVSCDAWETGETA